MAVMTKWLVIFHNGVHKSLLGFDEAHIRQKYPNVKSVFKMGIKHNTTQEK
jgi:hypothetical protein